MAHIAKYKAASCGHMLAHYRRDASSLGRENIDPFLAYVSRTGDSGIVCAGSFYDPRAGGIRTPNPEP